MGLTGLQPRAVAVEGGKDQILTAFVVFDHYQDVSPKVRTLEFLLALRVSLTAEISEGFTAQARAALTLHGLHLGMKR